MTGYICGSETTSWYALCCCCCLGLWIGTKTHGMKLTWGKTLRMSPDNYQSTVIGKTLIIHWHETKNTLGSKVISGKLTWLRLAGQKCSVISARPNQTTTKTIIAGKTTNITWMRRRLTAAAIVKLILLSVIKLRQRGAQFMQTS